MTNPGEIQQIEQLLVQKYNYPTMLATEAAKRASEAVAMQPGSATPVASAKPATPSKPVVERRLPSIADEDDTPTLAAVQEHPSGGKSGTEHQAAVIVELLRDKYGYPAEWAMPAAWRAKMALQTVADQEADAPDVPSQPAMDDVIRKGPVPSPAEPPETSAEDPPSTASYAASEGAKKEVATSKPKPTGRILLIACPRCGFPLKLPEAMFEQMKGRKARCPECEVKFLLPESLG
ncbi:hypothetical protein [Thalassoroseus pseudoceratinae]|uniref:hypothetical protein n=1 Tax=Thalassoroseus pseudoceratinae TaxID=2713176 RepID=UPI00141F8E7A|nr:hypothetical protein [Thalassoroseus pseudoceratinae]